ncbi:hypothetical protein [Hornefia butyriciproducens]|uniref:IS66 family transposase n=1 Tax=Hornefia butyriciproducens TaxID=2652293 RepID=UPI003F8ACF7D
MEKKQPIIREELKRLNKNELCRMILDMQETVQKNEEIISEKERLIAESESRIDILTQEVKLLQAQRFGRKSEMTDNEASENVQIAMDFVFNEAEATADTSGEEETVMYYSPLIALQSVLQVRQRQEFFIRLNTLCQKLTVPEQDLGRKGCVSTDSPNDRNA